jgi:hypothetical protein
MPQNKQKRDAHISGENQLLGWPGYRTRGSRSGLDVIETQAEAAHMEGVFYRNLLTLKARTRNPIYLILMFFFGVIPFPLLAYIIVYILKFPIITDFPTLALDFWLIFLLIITGAITINFAISVLAVFGLIPTQKNIKAIYSQAKQREKRQPKRRKDFR